MYMLLFTRYLLSFADSLEDPAIPTATAIRPVPLQPRIPCGRVCLGAPKYAPTYFYELVDDEVESDGSSIGDVAPSHRPS